MAAPVDPALLRLVPPVRSLIVRTGIFQALSTVLVLARGILIGSVAATVITRTALEPGAWPAGTWLKEPSIWWMLIALFAVVVVHAAVAGLAQREQSLSLIHI